MEVAMQPMLRDVEVEGRRAEGREGEEREGEKGKEEEEEEVMMMERAGEDVDATLPLLVQAGSSQGNSLTSNAAGPDDALYTVEEAIDHVGFGKFQAGMVVYAGLTWLADAAEMILLTFIGPAAKCEWDLSPAQEGAVSSAVFVGILLGAYSWGILADLRGRKFAFFATAMFTSFFGILSALSPTFWWLLISRTFVGIGLGGAGVAFSLCMEFLPTTGRGFWLVFFEFFWTVGSISEALLAWVIIPNMNWRWLVAVSALPFIFLLVFYPILPESPKYLMVKGNEEDAMSVLRRIAKMNGKPLPRGKLTAVRQGDVTRGSYGVDQVKLGGEDVEIEVDTAEDGKVKEIADRSGKDFGAWDTFKLLFSPELKRPTLLLWFLFFANAFTYYGLVLLTTQLEVTNGKEHRCDHASGVTVDTPECFSDGKPVIDTVQYTAVLISSVAEIPGVIVACLVVDRFGRKISLAGLLIACGAFMLPLLTPKSEVITNIFMFGARCSIMGGFSVLWAYAPELYHTKVRSTGVGAANSGGRLGGFLCPFVAVSLIQSCQRVLAVGFFAIAPVVAGLAVYFFPKEERVRKVSD